MIISAIQSTGANIERASKDQENVHILSVQSNIIILQQKMVAICIEIKLVKIRDAIMLAP
jgi:hypothetical protein